MATAASERDVGRTYRSQGVMKKTFLLSSILVATASEVIAAAYVLGPLSREPIWGELIWEELVPVVLMLSTCAAAVVAVLVASIALVMRRLKTRRARWLSRGPWLSAGLLVVGSMLLLGPVGGFHHMFRFGVLGYMILDCESRPTDNPLIPFGRCEVRGSAVLLVVTIGVWLSLVLLLSWLLRPRNARSAGFASEDEQG